MIRRPCRSVVMLLIRLARCVADTLSLSLAFTAAFASSPARFRSHKHPRPLSFESSPGRLLSQAAQLIFDFASIHGTCRFHEQPRSLSQAAFRTHGRFRKQLSVLSRAVQLAFAFTSIRGRFCSHLRSLSQAPTGAFASSPARFRCRKHSRSLLDSSASLAARC